MFVSVPVPREVREDLAAFLEPRQVGMRWIDPEQWHLTLAFMASVPQAREDELVERLGAVAARVAPFDLVLKGAGCFPDPSRASVLWLGVAEPARSPLERLAKGARAAANVSGAPPDGKVFVPHLTLARLRRPVEATRWLRVLGTYASPGWWAEEIELVASYLGEGAKGRPRHEVVARLPLAGSGEA